MRARTLPLGIDLGSTRVRIALAEAAGTEARLRAVVARDLPDGGPATTREGRTLVAAVLEEMMAELGVSERRCVSAFASPHAVSRVVRFPHMTWVERVRAARFEAARFVDWNMEDERTVVRVHPLERASGYYAIGAVRASHVSSHIDALRAAGLRPLAIDDCSLALRRALNAWDAVIDIGYERTLLHVFDGMRIRSVAIDGAGNAITRGIAQDLCIDDASAERRKRILGSAGAGLRSCDELVSAIADAVAVARTTSEIGRIALVGNGARLPGLAGRLEAATSTTVALPVADVLQGANYPEDVLRAAAPDWTLAAGLALWAA